MTNYTNSEVDDVERRERVTVVRDAVGEHRERVVENVGAEQRAKVFKAKQIIWLLTGLLEILIGLRIFLKLIAANPANPFASLIYNITNVFLWPFYGLTATPMAQNGVVLEFSSMIAMLIYALLAWLLVKIVGLLFTSSETRSVTVYDKELR